MKYIILIILHIIHSLFYFLWHFKPLKNMPIAGNMFWHHKYERRYSSSINILKPYITPKNIIEFIKFAYIQKPDGEIEYLSKESYNEINI